MRVKEKMTRNKGLREKERKKGTVPVTSTRCSRDQTQPGFHLKIYNLREMNLAPETNQ